MSIAEEQFVLDNVMYWEAFRWEQLNAGHIYIQKFPGGKKYAGQTTDLDARFRQYRNLRGNNPHHTRALKKHGWDKVKVAYMRCPKYLLDDVEIFVIDFFNLTDTTIGYNKTSGGRRGYRFTKEVRLKMSISSTGKKHKEGTRLKMSISRTGRETTKEARTKISKKMSGKNNPMFGKSHTEEVRLEMSKNRRGVKNNVARPICVFGKLYGTATDASDTLREVCNTTNKGIFMVQWVRKQKHQHNVFYVSKEFYEEMKYTTECITREMYNNWSAL